MDAGLGWIKGFCVYDKVGRERKFLHVLYADDTLLLCEADRVQAL